MTSRFDPSARTPQDRDRDRNWDEQLEQWMEYEQQITDRRDEHGDGWLAHLTEAEAAEAMRLMSRLAFIPEKRGCVMGDGMPAIERGRWEAFYIDPEQPNDGRGRVWRQAGGTLWSPDGLTGASYLSQTLAAVGLDRPVWAFAHCMPSDFSGQSWYSLHYPDGVRDPLPRDVPGDIGPHLWVPAPEAYEHARQRTDYWQRQRADAR